jgi:hypothetical protein
MSYERVLAGFNERFSKVPGLVAVLDKEPTSIQEPPIIYSLLDSFTRDFAETIIKIRYRTMHRLCIAWGDPGESEKVLRDYADIIPAAVEADYTLGGRSDVAVIVSGTTGWVTIDGKEYRTLDFFSEALEFVPVGATD